MKRIVLMVMLLVAGALALVFLTWWSRLLLSFVVPFGMLWGDSVGSGGIGSVSAGVPEAESGLLLFPSFLLWRVCANLAAGGGRVMARHRRFHGVVTIAGLLLVAAVVGFFVMALTIAPEGPPPLGVDVWGPIIIAVMMVMLPPAAFGLTVIQLFTVVVAFRTLVRGGQHAS